MAKKKTGLGIEALFPSEEEASEEAPPKKTRERQKSQAVQLKPQAKSRTASTSKQTTSREERIKTSVELLPETIELIDLIKSQHRREHRRHLPMWKILDDAVRELARHLLKLLIDEE